MRVVHGDLWEIEATFRVIPTNLTTKSDGAAVMGLGVAKQAALLYPNLPYEYGHFLKTVPQPSLFTHHGYHTVCLPVKRHWRDKADLGLIEEGVRQLAGGARLLTITFPEKLLTIALPVLGCGYGELSAREVRPILERHLQDNQTTRFILVLRDEEATRKHAATLRAGTRVDRAALRDLRKL